METKDVTDMMPKMDDPGRYVTVMRSIMFVVVTDSAHDAWGETAN
jgi:hypothetical protein